MRCQGKCRRFPSMRAMERWFFRPVAPAFPAAAGKRLPRGLLDVLTRRLTRSTRARACLGTKKVGVLRNPDLLGRSGYLRRSLAAFLAFVAPLPEPPGLLLLPVALPSAAFLTAPSTFLPIPA